MSRKNTSHAMASLDNVLDVLRAAGEPTRLRLLVLLREGELNVTDLTSILNQSQPRISRHLKLLAEAHLIERYREGSWAFFRLNDGGMHAALTSSIMSHIAAHDPQCQQDRERLEQVRQERAAHAARYFSTHADNWDTIRALHMAEEALERGILNAVGDAPLHDVLDIGTGTGRMLELLAPRATRAVGIDQSVEMLSVARANIARAGLSSVQLRQGDIYELPVPPASFDLVIVHQVLHFLEEPARALREAAQALRSGGRLLVVDFAPHELEFLRETQAHRRLGFAPETVSGWMEQAGLGVVQQKNFAPPEGQEDGLTVSLWMGKMSASHISS
jgi:ubiquinone/menaquinone biosynthesis C-methylase UbiE/DNA-binding transcriptional ArsR family regulator